MANSFDRQFTQDKAEIRRIVEDMTLFDDDLMSRVFDNNIPATELLLSIILNRRWTVVSVHGQEELKNAVVGGRNIVLDIHAVDELGEAYNIEVQGDSEGAHVRRARYHSSMLDTRMLKQGEAFSELRDAYVIFMYKHDKFGRGLPLYHADRYVSETGELLGDGSHIIYVNGRYKGEDPLGLMIRDFHQKDIGKMHYGVLADSVNHFKNRRRGDDDMCEAVEAYCAKVAEQVREIVTVEVTEEVTRTVTAEVTEAVTREVTESVTRDVTEEVTEKVTISVTMQTRLEAIKQVMKNIGLSLELAMDALGIEGEDRKVLAEKILLSSQQ